jgi:hypothetical protein
MFLRKIRDIRIANNKITVIRDAEISIRDLEDQISSIDYIPASDTKDAMFENSKFPPFIQVFYFLFFKALKIPSEKEFWETYLSWVGGENIKGEIVFDGQNYSSIGIKNRLNRTYPSLIRDLHFLYLLDASKRFESVDYSMERDYFNGLDLKLVHGHHAYFISIFIDTSRGNYYKKKKANRHNYSSVTEIELKVDFNSLFKKGSIYLLNTSHIEQLETLLNEK